MAYSSINTLLNALIPLKMFLIKQFLWKPLTQKTNYPQQAQNDLLRDILERNKDTTFGKAHGFGKITSYAEFCKAVPVQSYEDLRPYIEKQEEEKQTHLNVEQPSIYAQTSGTLGKPKYIPILKSSISQYHKSQQCFTYALYASIPGIYSGKVLAIVSPAIEGYLDTGIPYGSMSGLIYKSVPRFILSKYAIPPEVLEIEDYELKYYLITVYALAESNITLIATANPSTLLKITTIIESQIDMLISDIEIGNQNGLKANPSRAKGLKLLKAKKGTLTFADIWPNLKAITTWTGGSCSILISSLKKQLTPSTHIVEMGYLSSEFRGSITVDILNSKAMPTLHENFFEFVKKEDWERENPTFLTLEQIEEGNQYYVVATTQNGLYRYFINDIIKVTGVYNNTPTIQFVQKGKGVTNITGEKLYESQLIQAMDKIKQEHDFEINFFMMLADSSKLQYTLYLEHEPVEALAIEKHLLQLNIEYESKRQSGRLKPLIIQFLKDGTSEAYKKHCITNGQREGQFKVQNIQYAQNCSFDFSKHVIQA